MLFITLLLPLLTWKYKLHNLLADYMDNVGGLGFSGMKKPSKKRRSNLNRRRLNESESPQDYHDSISVSSTPSDLVSDAPSEVQKSSDENELLGENPVSGSSSGMEMKESKTSEIGAASDGIGSENKFRKVKLKVGGVTRTIHTKSSSDGSSVAGTSATYSQSDAIYPYHKLGRRGRNSLDEEGGFRPVPWKDFSITGFSFEKVVKMKHEKSHKTKHATNKSLSDEAYDEEDDDEIRYLQKLKSSKTSSSHGIGYEDEKRSKKLRKLSTVMDRDSRGHDLNIGDYDSSRSGKESKKPQPLRAAEDIDYMEEEEEVEELVSYDAIKPENKMQRRESIDVKSRSSITTRRKAIQTASDNSLSLGPGLIQFPDGLPPAPPRKQKEQLTEVEQQLKRAEAAKRRKMQNEKAALESQAEAIRRILGQDSSRKRREDKIKKRREELAQERNMNASTLAPNIVRWVMRPSGTVVTFPDEIGLPSIFEPKPCSYPPPREKCAGPECTNTYKYRDSKSKLPLCSLHCYKAINERCKTKVHYW